MDKFYSKNLEREIQQINAVKARKLFEQGKTIYLHPNKMKFDNEYQAPTSFKKGASDWRSSFDKICDYFRYYNCGCGRGSYIHFFVAH